MGVLMRLPGSHNANCFLNPVSNYGLGVVILGAGRSTRMGKPKLLLPWGATTVLGHLINQWRALGAAQVAVVHAADDAAILAELHRLAFPAENRIANPDADRGMFSSILCAAQWRGWQPTPPPHVVGYALTHWAIVLGDQPHLRRETLERLIAFTRQHPEQICQPQQNGRLRHPVVLPRTVFAELAESRAEALKEFLQARPVSGCGSDDPGLDLDIDRPEDYQRALVLAGITGQ